MPLALLMRISEADRLLETGTIAGINHIASFTPVSRQTVKNFVDIYSIFDYI